MLRKEKRRNEICIFSSNCGLQKIKPLSDRSHPHRKHLIDLHVQDISTIILSVTSFYHFSFPWYQEEEKGNITSNFHMQFN